MLIALHDAEKEHLKNKTFPNYALMKISAYHKALGDTVVWWEVLHQHTYDKIYSSKVFDFTSENEYLRADTIKGGTGYGLYENLPSEIDNMFPDYSIYPECDYAIGFITRGCTNKCEWCYVPKKEGYIKPYRKWQDIIRQDTNKVVLMDNNILACDCGLQQLEELGKTDYLIDLNQGMDIRLLTDDICKILKNIKWLKYIRFSCDAPSQLPYFEKMIDLFNRNKIPKSKVFIYTLVRQNLIEAEERILKLHNICKSFNTYAQAERNTPKGIIPSKEQLEFTQRYVYGNSYKKESFKEYKKRLGLAFKENSTSD